MIIGEERNVIVRLGASHQREDGAASTNATLAGDDDQVYIRGPTDEVARVQKEILRIADEAKNHEMVNSYVSLPYPYAQTAKLIEHHADC